MCQVNPTDGIEAGEGQAAQKNHGQSGEEKEELSAGRIIIDITKITPTDSNEAVSTKHRITISPY